MAQKAEGVLGLHTFEISKNGLQETTNVNDTFHHQKGVTAAVEENTEYIFIYLNNLQVHIIPKRDFPSPEQVRQFNRLNIEYWWEVK